MSKRKVSVVARASAVFLGLSSIVMTLLAVHPATATVGSASVSPSIKTTSSTRIPAERPDSAHRPQKKPVVRAARRRKARAHGPVSPFGWPVKKNHITVPFGWRHAFELKDRVVVPLPGMEFHHGLDIACAEGEPVFASRSGVVILSGTTLDYGNVIVIQHPAGWSTLYGHMERRMVSTGQRVRRHQVIGRCGETGRATGPHVHFEIRKNGVFLDPKRFLR